MDILWSPNHDDKFLTLGSDLSLYKVDTIQYGTELKPGSGICKLSDSTYSTLLAANTDNHYIKCVAWYPKPQPENMVAIGLATGKVLLTSIARTGASNPNSLIGKEFIPKHNRQCNYLAWNPVETSLLAAGLEKHRSDSSVQIWDIMSRTTDLGLVNGSRRRNMISSSDAVIMKPTVELGQSEASQSLAWFPRESNTLVTGFNHRFLRIYDLRDCSHPKSVAYTKAVNGVTVDPHFNYRLASFTENQLTIWDTRHFEKPVLTKHENRNIIKLEWSPVRSGLIAYLPKDSAVVKLYDIQPTSEGSDELEPAVIERTLPSHGSGHGLSSFNWHPHHENRLLTITSTGTVSDEKVFERIALSWSPDIYLSWASSRQVMQCHTIKLSREANEDISIRMKRRASRGYGTKKEIDQNGEVCDEPQLQHLWNWLAHLKSVSKSDAPSMVPRETVLLGVWSVLHSFYTNRELTGSGLPRSSSNVDFLAWHGVDGHKLKGQKKIFRSEERLKALQLTGWGFEKDTNSTAYIDMHEKNGEFDKAAAVSVFTLRMSRAIQVLNNGAKRHGENVGVNLTAVAMALSGFTDDKNTLWKEMCAEMRSELKNPYLTAMFAFLALDDTGSQSAILEDENISVIDRVSFACMYLPDQKLLEYVTDLQQKLTEKGDLNGMLLTGLSTAGVDLLENYISRTSDVQTACCVIASALPNPEIRKDIRVVNWIENYRELLDMWRLWHERAEFDVFLNTCDTTEKPMPQVHASCHFCGKSIGNVQNVKTWNYRSQTMAFHYSGRMPHPSNVKSTMCPGCRKPLPRCALCLIHMGTPSGSGRQKPLTPSSPTPPQNSLAQVDMSEDRHKLSCLADWFSWCQSCRHGGHAQHMSDWFREHTQCPVTGCSCKCNTLDMPLTNVTTEHSSSLVPAS